MMKPSFSAILSRHGVFIVNKNIKISFEGEEGVIVAQECGGLVHGPEHSGVSIDRLEKS